MEQGPPTPQPFRFSDPRHQRIYKELKEVVGPGPAAFFRDACWLMTNPGQLHSAAHLAAHLLREIESALRTLFRPVVEREGKPEDSRSQKEEIRLILQSIGNTKDAPEERAWFELAEKLHGLAHRRGLDAPRALEEIFDLWEKSQVLLDVLLRAFRERFLTWLRVLDELLAKPQPIKDDVARLAQEIPNNAVTRGYFFDRLENREWLEPLRAKGFFRHPPQPERNEQEGTIRFPPWPEARYLARMARHKPELVAQIIQEMDDTDDAAVLTDLVDALLAMPPNVSGRLVEKAKRWAESPYLLLPKKLGQLISHLAKGGKTEEAMAIARVLLDVLPDPRQQQLAALGEPYRLPPEPRARFDTWEYEQILKKHYPDLVGESGLAALKLLCDLLEQTIRLSRTREDDQGPEYFTSFWRPAIEHHPQNLGHTVMDALVSAVRDGAELLIRAGRATVEEVVNTLEGRRWKVFRRIVLHVLSLFPEQAEPLVAARLTDRSLFEDVGLRHEYVLLLRDHFPRLTLEDQAKILGWIEDGPEVDRRKQRWEEKMGRKPSEEDVARFREIWQRDWLARLGPESLPAEWHERYQGLVKKHGEAEHPEFPVYTEGWVGPTSPKTADELKAMSVTEIVEFLRTWEPPENMLFESSPKGLGRTLSSVVAEDPGHFAAEAKRFKNLDPTYVSALLSGLREALKQGKTFHWEPVFELSEWVVSQPREIPGRKVDDFDADPDWGWTRKTIADLLSAGFEDHPSGIPIRFRQKVWAILKPLTDDPDPTPEHEQRYGGSNMDPATLSINTTRGEAMHAIVRYALWVQRHLEKEPRSQERLQKGFEEMPEVREVLEAHLDPAREPSLAIRSVYGQWFPWLVLLDPDWARANAAKIFPQDQASEAFFEAAWNTYIAFCSPYDSVWEVLRPFYGVAVDRVGGRSEDTRWLADPDNELAEHLMVFYWRGKLALDDSLLMDFWDKASDDLRAHAIAFIGRALKQTEEDIPAEVMNRLKDLWERRLEAATQAADQSQFEKEVSAFGWWFASGKLDIGWALDQLLASLKLGRRTQPVHMVLETLSATAHSHPLKSVRCLRRIAQGDPQGWELYAGRDDVRRILQLGMENTDAREETKQLIHCLGSRGFLGFRDLLSG
ncbi:MAG: hypothetical protein KatS3mg109_1076 [Pirellulaceae bacterium]|nr:MAG: hypothetical protein KatS3mg109_1076 [Pirellulaceae bacterium]